MRLLLDTHTLIWLLNRDSALSSAALAAISDRHHEKLLNVGSLWEITIKVGLGKLEIGQPLAEFFTRIKQTGMIEPLNIEHTHRMRLAALPHHHRDPFDRLSVAQAFCEKCTLVSRDTQLDAYGVTRLW